MVKFKEVESDEAVRDIEEEILDEADLKEDLGDAEGGIFDEDFADVESLRDAIGEPEEVSSDFDIGSTLLSAAAPVGSWQGQNLEETISRERIEKDWGDDDEFVAGDFYKASDSGGDFYGRKSGGSDLYKGGSGSDLYKESGSSGADVYNTGGSSAKSGDGLYVEKKSSIGSYDELRDKRRGGRSMLEIAGYEDKDKGEQRDLRSDVRYEARDAA